jgi:hypothetical protein
MEESDKNTGPMIDEEHGALSTRHRQARTLRAVAIVLVVITVIYLLVLRWPTPDSTFSAEGQLDTRKVFLTSTGTVEFSLLATPTTNTAIIVLDGHEVIIKDDSVLYQDKEVMKLAPDSKKVDITHEHGQVTVSDGVAPAQSFHL